MSALNTEFISNLAANRQSAIVRDLRLNLERILNDSALDPQESLLILLAVSSALHFDELVVYAKNELKSRDLTEEQIQEADESAAIMGMLNTYYKFKHMVGKNEEYRTAGLRMTALAKPSLGKERFEMLALAVSIINGCESCIKSHEEVLVQSGVPTAKIHDLARLTAVLKGLSILTQFGN